MVHNDHLTSSAAVSRGTDVSSQRYRSNGTPDLRRCGELVQHAITVSDQNPPQIPFQKKIKKHDQALHTSNKLTVLTVNGSLAKMAFILKAATYGISYGVANASYKMVMNSVRTPAQTQVVTRVRTKRTWTGRVKVMHETHVERVPAKYHCPKFLKKMFKGDRDSAATTQTACSTRQQSMPQSKKQSVTKKLSAFFKPKTTTQKTYDANIARFLANQKRHAK